MIILGVFILSGCYGKNVVIFKIYTKHKCSGMWEDFRVNEILKKLKLTTQNPVLILNAPEEYEDTIKDIEAEVHTEIKIKYKFIQLFARSVAEAKEYMGTCVEALDGDGYLWLCYPKGTSKKYKKSDLNRDTTYQVTEPYNFQGVTLVSVDNDWSAFRIRHNDYIKSTKK